MMSRKDLRWFFDSRYGRRGDLGTDPQASVNALVKHEL
jgi:hypothetical protein